MDKGGKGRSLLLPTFFFLTSPLVYKLACVVGGWVIILCFEQSNCGCRVGRCEWIGSRRHTVPGFLRGKTLKVALCLGWASSASICCSSAPLWTLTYSAGMERKPFGQTTRLVPLLFIFHARQRSSPQNALCLHVSNSHPPLLLKASVKARVEYVKVCSVVSSLLRAQFLLLHLADV